jgi:hypothetical protein
MIGAAKVDQREISASKKRSICDSHRRFTPPTRWTGQRRRQTKRATGCATLHPWRIQMRVSSHRHRPAVRRRIPTGVACLDLPNAANAHRMLGRDVASDRFTTRGCDALFFRKPMTLRIMRCTIERRPISIENDDAFDRPSSELKRKDSFFRLPTPNMRTDADPGFCSTFATSFSSNFWSAPP